MPAAGPVARQGCAIQVQVRQLQEKKPGKLISAQPLRFTASLVMGVIFLHLLLTHKDVQRKQETAQLITLPESQQRPKQVEFLHTSPEEMPLAVEEPGVLAEAELQELQASLFNSSWLVPLGRRAGRMGEKGVTITLNTGGVEALQRAANLSDLAAFFSRERLPTANAWVLSLVAFETCAGFVADQGIWAVHQDSLASSTGGVFETPDSVLKLAPHSINIFHVYVPAGLNGGATWVWMSYEDVDGAPAAIIAPRANVKVTIRGDALHGTSGQNASVPGAPVVSLVLEQYEVPTALYSQTQEFRVEPLRTEYRAKRPDLRYYRPFTDEQKAAAILAAQSQPANPNAAAATDAGNVTHSTNSNEARTQAAES